MSRLDQVADQEERERLLVELNEAIEDIRDAQSRASAAAEELGPEGFELLEQANV